MYGNLFAVQKVYELQERKFEVFYEYLQNVR